MTMVTKTFTFEGKRYYIRGKTEKEAETKAALRLHDLEEGKREISKNMLVSAWAEEWIATYKEPVVNQKQYRAIHSVISKFINPTIGSLQLKNVKPVHLQKLMNGLTIYSNSYISKIYDIVRQIFKEAYHNDLVLTNPAEALKKPSGRKSAKDEQSLL